MKIFANATQNGQIGQPQVRLEDVLNPQQFRNVFDELAFYCWIKMFGNVPASDQQINGILVRRASIVKGTVVDCLSGFHFDALDGRGRGGCGLLGVGFASFFKYCT